jgi:gamma-glutamylcyclotransferase (GGCT)/AIG2-like uncharacterized protein YtfP
MSAFLFSYGSLQQDRIQLELFGRLLKGKRDAVNGYRLSTVENRDKAAVAGGEEKFHRIVIFSNDYRDRVEGTVLEVTDEELLLADQYEPVDYIRVSVVLASGKQAWIYAAANPAEHAG